jgi:hypothetical protein
MLEKTDSTPETFPPAVKKRPFYIGFWWGKRFSPGGVLLFIILALGAFFAGFDNEVGIIMGYIAAAVLMVELTHRWRKIWSFVVLMVVSFVGGIILAFLQEEVVYPLVALLGGPGAIDNIAVVIFHEAVSLTILFFGPVGIIFGFFGAIILSIVRLVKIRKQLNQPT